MRIILLGPTAVGKTSLSTSLADAVDAEIISADSRQCYKYLDIGTAKPSEEELERVTHYNISILEPDEDENVANFTNRVRKWEQAIEAKGKNILFVGGSTLYIKALIKPLDDVPESDKGNIEKLEKQIEEKGIEPLYDKLKKVDPEYADSMDGMNTQRIVRALDVWMQTGKPFSSFHSEDDDFELPEDTFVYGLKRGRKVLYERINSRVENMIEEGFVEEVRKLLDMGFDEETPALNSVGYRDAIQYLNGEKTRETLIEDMKIQTRHYAKRQLTWFRRWDFVDWIDMDQTSHEQALNYIVDTLAAKRQNR